MLSNNVQRDVLFEHRQMHALWVLPQSHST